MEEASTSKGDGSHLQIRFITKQTQYSVPDIPFVVPANTGYDELNNLLRELLKESAVVGEKEVEFDFLAADVLVRCPLVEHIADLGVSAESVIVVEYFEKLPSPEPEECLLHDDWVSAVHTNGKWILTGCYDNTLHLWTAKGKHKLTIPGHTASVKGVAWVSPAENSLVSFVSVSHDQSAMLWEWNMDSNAVECVHTCRGHERSVECVAVDPTANKFATGGWDSLLKVWSASLHRDADADLETSSKRARRDVKSHVRTPLLTLQGHKEAISGVVWLSQSQLVTSSWDHTLKVWDVEYSAIKTEMAGMKSFFDVHASPLNGCLLTASADRHIRMYDPRSTEGSLVKSTFTSHREWVQSVRWSTTEDNLFISGAYDHRFKLWDTRNCKMPLFDLLGHEDKVLCCDWSNPKYLVSGGADNTLRIFKSKKYGVSSKSDANEDIVR